MVLRVHAASRIEDRIELFAWLYAILYLLNLINFPENFSEVLMSPENEVEVFNGDEAAGHLDNGLSFYVSEGEMVAMDAEGKIEVEVEKTRPYISLFGTGKLL